MWAPDRFNQSIRVRKSIATQEMSDDAMFKAAPSIFADRPWEGMKANYLFVPTIHVVSLMQDNGFVPVRAMQSKCRTPGKSDFTKHMVVFRDLSKQYSADDTIPEFLLVNSHDGACSYQVHFGVFVFICANGLIVADSTVDSIKCRHSKNVAHDIIEGTHTLIKEAPTVSEKIELFKSITLSYEEQRALAQSSLIARYGQDELFPITPQQLLEERRPEDKGPSLWKTFNRIEENMMRGGLITNNPGNKRVTKTREIKGISENVRLEKAMWFLSEFMANHR